jgi:hypothetical protein
MKLLFSKSNYNRKAKFRLKTTIYSDGNGFKVVKTALSANSQEHLHNIVSNYELLSKLYSNINFVRVYEIDTNNIGIDYKNIPTLESLIENCLFQKNYKEALKYFSLFDNFIQKIPVERKNVYDNENFCSIFDNTCEFKSELTERCFNKCLLDLNLDNILSNSEIFLIDQEWVFQFPIPRNFIIFRSIFNLSNKLQQLIILLCSLEFPCYQVTDSLIIPKDWLDRYSFSQETIKRYISYEENFQNFVNEITNYNKAKVLPVRELKTTNEQNDLTTFLNHQISHDLLLKEKEYNHEIDILTQEINGIKLSRTYKIIKRLLKLKTSKT